MWEQRGPPAGLFLEAHRGAAENARQLGHLHRRASAAGRTSGSGAPFTVWRKSKSVAAAPVISRALRLNVSAWIAHLMSTITRLSNCTRYRRWMNAQTSQAGRPDTWS